MFDGLKELKNPRRCFQDFINHNIAIVYSELIDYKKSLFFVAEIKGEVYASDIDLNIKKLKKIYEVEVDILGVKEVFYSSKKPKRKKLSFNENTKCLEIRI